MLRSKEPFGLLGAAIASRAGHLVGSEVRVVTDSGEERSLNVDSVCRELVEGAMKILLEAREAVTGLAS